MKNVTSSFICGRYWLTINNFVFVCYILFNFLLKRMRSVVLTYMNSCLCDIKTDYECCDHDYIKQTRSTPSCYDHSFSGSRQRAQKLVITTSQQLNWYDLKMATDTQQVRGETNRETLLCSSVDQLKESRILLRKACMMYVDC